LMLQMVCLFAVAVGISSGSTPSAADLQPQAPQVPVTPIEPVLTHVPGDAMCVLVINSIRAFTDKLDKYIADIGLAEQAAPLMPEGALAALKGVMAMGEGFNPDGGFAVAMLNPEDFGIDLLGLMGVPGGTPPDPAAGPPQLPFVLFIPGPSVEQVFPQFQTSPAGDYTTVMMPMGPMLAGKSGGYILMSPSREALDKLKSRSEGSSVPLAGEVAKLLGEADLAVRVNMKLVGPMYVRALEGLTEQVNAAGPATAPGTATTMPSSGPFGPFGSLVSAWMPMYREFYTSMNSVVLALSIDEAGLAVDELVTFDPQSKFAKMNAAYVGAPPAKLDRVPDMPYVIAAAGTWPSGPKRDELVELGLEMVDQLLAGLNLTEETGKQLRAMAADFYDEVDGMQFVLGGAPQGSGVFGLGVVVQCDDAGKMRSLLVEKTGMSHELLTSILGERAEQIKFNYLCDVATVQGASVDAIDVTFPQLESLDEQDKSELAKVLGEEKLRLYVARADDKTLVVTFGGSQAFLGEAIKAARSGGPIAANPDTVEALKHLPPDSCFVMLLNPGNLTDLVLKGAEVMGAGESVPPIKIDCTIPIAMGSVVDENSASVRIFIPTALVRETVGMVKGMIPPAAPGPAQPQPMQLGPPVGGGV